MTGRHKTSSFSSPPDCQRRPLSCRIPFPGHHQGAGPKIPRNYSRGPETGLTIYREGRGRHADVRGISLAHTGRVRMVIIGTQ